MSTLTEIVSLTISQDSVGIARAGFGTPLLLSYTARFPERVREYESLAEVAEDFPTTTSVEYLTAQAIFGQSPHPTSMKIGRGALAPTQVYVIAVSALRNNDSDSYKIQVDGDGVTSTLASPAATDGSAANDEIVDLIVTALNGVVGKNYTAAATGSVGSKVVTVTATAAGDWLSLEVLDPTALAIKQTHADPGIATDLAAISLEDDDWYFLLTSYNSSACVLAAAAAIEPQAKMYVVDVNDTVAITGAVNGDADTVDKVQALNRTRTAVGYHPSPVNMFSAAWVGRVAPIDPGGDNWKFKTLSGVEAVSLTATQRSHLAAKSGNTYVTVANIDITIEGYTSDGGYIDSRRGLDWLTDDMTKGVFGALAGPNKVPFTDNGIAIVENEVLASLTRAVNKGILAASPKPTVTVPRASAVSSTDKSQRTLRNVKFRATQAGTINNVEIAGTVSV